MFRDRTNLFISYRRTFPHHLSDNLPKKKKKSKRISSLSDKKKSRFELLPEEEQGLITDQDFQDFEISDDEEEDDGFDDLSINDNNHENIEMTTLPPAFLDIADEIDSLIKEIESKTESLRKLYKKNLLPGFNNRTEDEEEIEKLNYIITTKFQSCFSLIKKLELIKNKKILTKSSNKSELIMLENIKKNYALKIQQTSSNFRKIQNNYIKYLKEDDFEPITTKPSSSSFSRNNYDPVLEELETAEAESYSRNAIKQTQIHNKNDQINNIVHQREQEINNIAKGVLEVSAIFKEMQNMVIEQGTILDRIDYNLENTKIELKAANKDLTKATSYQKQNNKCKLILLLTLIVLALLMTVIVKPKHHNNNDDNNNDNKNENNNDEESNNNNNDGIDTELPADDS